MLRGLFESGLPVILPFLLVLGAIVLIVWALVLWIRVAHRWLRLHPAPPREGRTDRSAP